jgi:hypothetical protein
MCGASLAGTRSACAASSSGLGLTSDRSPHTLQRTMTVCPSLDKPTTCVLWLPHLGQIRGGLGLVISNAS